MANFEHPDGGVEAADSVHSSTYPTASGVRFARIPFRQSRACQALLATCAAIWAQAVGGGVTLGDEPVRPNVLLIMTDDQGWGDIGSHGNEHLDTPHLDRLAENGARFDRFFVSPVCAPTRAGLLTGRYHLRTGTHGVTRGEENMRGEELTVAEAFRDAGYATGCFGKWHNGAHFPYHPNGQGFESFVGFCSGHWNNYFSTPLEENGETIESTGYIADYLTARAIDFMTADRGQPFFCYVPLNTPHSPWQVADEYFDRYRELGLDEKAACAYAMCANIDDNVGKMLDALETTGQLDQTIVIFLTDNGPNSNRFNGGMRGRKGSVHEGGVRVPLFIQYPARIDAGTRVDAISANIDLMPTLLDYCSIDVGTDRVEQWDGVSLRPLIEGERWEYADRKLFTFRRKGELGAVRTQQYRLTIERGRVALFDMEQDPEQTTNVADAHPSLFAELKLAYDELIEEMSAGELRPLPIPVGYDDVARVSMPAHEAFLVRDESGSDEERPGISYVGPNGWANDWITNWTDPKATAHWELESVNSGIYRVNVRYTCEPSSVGTRMRCSVADQSVVFTIQTEVEQVFVPSPDRIPRGEVYEVAQWGSVEAGLLAIPDGSQRLTISIATLEGERAPDIKAVELIRVGE